MLRTSAVAQMRQLELGVAAPPHAGGGQAAAHGRSFKPALQAAVHACSLKPPLLALLNPPEPLFPCPPQLRRWTWAAM